MAGLLWVLPARAAGLLFGAVPFYGMAYVACFTAPATPRYITRCAG